MIRKIFLMIMVAASLSKIYCSVVDKVIAKVNDETILSSEYEKLLNSTLEQYKLLTDKDQQTEEKISDLKQKVLDQLIEDKLLVQEAKKRKITATNREIEEGIKTIKDRFPSDEAFRLELKKENLTEKQFRERVTKQILVMKLINEEIKDKIVQPTEEEAKKVYDNVMEIIKNNNSKINKDEKEELSLLAKLIERFFDEQVRVRHILVRLNKDSSKKDEEEALKKIKAIQKEVLAGGDFAEIAKRSSEDKTSAINGGDLGFIAKGDTLTEFEKTAFSLKEGQVSDIIKTDFGYHIIKVVEKKSKRKPNFDDIKQDLLQYVYRKNTEKVYADFISSLKKKAVIKIIEPIK